MTRLQNMWGILSQKREKSSGNLWWGTRLFLASVNSPMLFLLITCKCSQIGWAKYLHVLFQALIFFLFHIFNRKNLMTLKSLKMDQLARLPHQKILIFRELMRLWKGTAFCLQLIPPTQVTSYWTRRTKILISQYPALRIKMIWMYFMQKHFNLLMM